MILGLHKAGLQTRLEGVSVPCGAEPDITLVMTEGDLFKASHRRIEQGLTNRQMTITIIICGRVTGGNYSSVSKRLMQMQFEMLTVLLL